MTRAVAVLLLAGCAQTEAGFFCERIAADTPLSSLPTRELVPASNKSAAFWAIHGRWLWDDVGGACCGPVPCADDSHCEALLARLRVSVLDKPYSTDCGNGGWGMCHVIVDEADRIVATTYRCQD